MSSKVAAVVVFLGWLLVSIAPTSAQMMEMCITDESDPDGDGRGWENETTCQVVGSTLAINDVRNFTVRSINPADGSTRRRYDYPFGLPVQGSRVAADDATFVSIFEGMIILD